jgi:leader peptidase (prepilin peptidase)/N-methyltransferase
MAAFFVLSFLWWPVPLIESAAIAHFVLWLVAGVLFGILFAYDAKWYLLPDAINFSLVAVGLLVATLVITQSPDMISASLSVLASVGVMGGLYLAIYLVSKGNWVGFGDVKLGLGLGLLLADWQLAVVALFAANLVGSLIVLPGVIGGKLRPKSQVPFGPLLIVGAIIGKLFGAAILEYYFIVLL